MFCFSGQEHFLLRARFLVSSPGPENIVHTSKNQIISYFDMKNQNISSCHFLLKNLTTELKKNPF